VRLLVSLRHFVEFVAFRIILAIIDVLPHGGAVWLARTLAVAWWVGDWPRRHMARDNILACGIETDPRRANALGRRSSQHLGQVVIESLKSAKLLDQDSSHEHVRLEIAADVLAVLDNPEQGLIVTSGHFGNWEIAAQLLSRFKPIAGITRAMDNPRIEEVIQSRKPRYRFNPIPKYDADPNRFISVLESGEILALLTDQHARFGGMWIDFFGRPAATYTTAAMLHLVTRAPLCFAVCRRVGPTEFELSTSDLIEHPPTGDRKADVRAIFAVINGHLEEAIRRDPEQYLWAHNRWRKLQKLHRLNQISAAPS